MNNEAAGFSAGEVFWMEQPIPDESLHLKKKKKKKSSELPLPAAILMEKNVSINNKKNVLTLMDELLGAFNLDC